MFQTTGKWLRAPLLGVVGLTVGALPALAETRLVLSHHFPTNNMVHETIVKFAELVEERTTGEIVIDIRPAGQLFAMEAAVDALDLGTVDLAWGNVSALQKWAPSMGVVSLPFVFDDSDHARRALYGELGEAMREEVVGSSGVDILAYGNAGFRIIVGNRPMAQASDLVGTKFRVANISVFVEMARALGGNPTPLAATEIYTAMQTGVIDVFEGPADYLLSLNVWDVADHTSLTNHMFTAGAMMASQNSMNALSPEHQQIIRDAAVEIIGEYMWNLSDAAQVAAWDQLASRMNATAEPDMASFREATAKMVADFAAGYGESATRYLEMIEGAAD